MQVQLGTMKTAMMKTSMMKTATVRGHRLLWAMLILTLALMLNLGTSHATVVNEPYDPGLQKLIIAGDISYPPYEYVDSNGVFKGFNVDIVTALGIQTGMDIEFKPMKWADAIKALQEGKIDAVQGMTVSRSRNEQFVFSDATLTNQEYIFVRTEENYIHELSDIRKKTVVALQRGDIGEEVLVRNKNLVPLYFDNQQEAIEALIVGKADIYVGNRLTGLYFTQKLGYESRLKIVGSPVVEAKYGIAFRKNISSETLNRFNRGLNEISRNGTYNKIHWKWFGETTIYKLESTQRQMTALLAVLLTVLIVLMAYVGLNRTLKKEVKRRTEEIEHSKNLLENSELFKSGIIEGISSAIICFDRSDSVILNNRLACALLGISDLSTMKWSDFESRFGFRNFESETDQYMELGNHEVEIEGQGKKIFSYSLSRLWRDDRLLIIADRTQERRLTELVYQDDKMKTVGMLASSIAHEIRTPLTVIKATVTLIRMKGGFNEYANEKMMLVDTETDRLSNLLTQILDYNRPKSTEKDFFLLSEAVNEILQLFHAKFREKNIQFTSKVEASIVYADINNFKQIIINLMMNALDAVERGGHIEIGSSVSEGYAKVFVKDSGIGMNEETTRRIFEVFYTGKTTGAGLGLTICRQLAEENDGKIEVESVLGEGTTMILTLPAFKKK